MTRERLAELKRILAEDDGPATDFSQHERFGTDGVLELIAAVESFREQQHVICSWCNHRTNREGRTDQELQDTVNEHVLACEKRPERKLLGIIYAMTTALGIDPEGADADALIDLFQKKWDEVCDGRDALLAEIQRLKAVTPC